MTSSNATNYNKKANERREEEGKMTAEVLTAFLLAVLREEMLAHCVAEGNAIVLHFPDGNVRIVRVE